MVDKSISGHTAAGMSRLHGGQIRNLFTIFSINKWHLFFTTIVVFIFKTSGYNGKCDGLWVW